MKTIQLTEFLQKYHFQTEQGNSLDLEDLSKKRELIMVNGHTLPVTQVNLMTLKDNTYSTISPIIEKKSGDTNLTLTGYEIYFSQDCKVKGNNGTQYEVPKFSHMKISTGSEKPVISVYDKTSKPIKNLEKLFNQQN